jgi:hypothetical protein
MIEYLKLFLVIVCPIVTTIKVIYDTREVCFAGGEMSTDNEKMLYAASKISFFNWPSKIHSIENSRAETREYWVIFIKLLQIFYKNKITDHVNFTLALIANCVSAILIYFIMCNYFNSNVGVIVSLLYSSCIWAYQIIFVIGHVHLSQMFFLLTVLTLQMTSILDNVYSVYLYFFAGVLTITSFVSSSASRKYPLLAIIVLVFSFQEFAVFPWEIDYFISTNVGIYLGGLLLFIFSKIFIKYQKNNFAKILGIMTNKDIKTSHIEFATNILLNTILVYFFFASMFPDFSLITKQFIAYVSGVIVVSLHILLPTSTMKENIVRYILWLMGTWRSHFSSYPDQEKTFGKKLPDEFRGHGLRWTYQLFWRVIPVVFVLYASSFIVVTYDTFTGSRFENNYLAAIYLVSITIVSLFPLIVSEITSSLQVGKAYFPSFIGILIMIGLASNIILNEIGDNQTGMEAFFAFAFTIIILQIGLSLTSYFNDILPARMATTILRNHLKKINVKEIYTYDNSYNDSLVKSMTYSYPGEFKVKHITGIKDVAKGIIVVPGTSSKSESMESQQLAILNGDFREDEILNELYKNKDIEKLAISKIITRGCSKYFVLESEVTGYRDLILNQVSEYDRWIANAWILSAEEVHSFNASKKTLSS